MYKIPAGSFHFGSFHDSLPGNVGTLCWFSQVPTRTERPGGLERQEGAPNIPGSLIKMQFWYTPWKVAE